MSLDMEYIQGATALIHSILKNTKCPQNVFFHFMILRQDDTNNNNNNSTTNDRYNSEDPISIVRYYFPFIAFETYPIDEERLKDKVFLCSLLCTITFIVVIDSHSCHHKYPLVLLIVIYHYH